MGTVSLGHYIYDHCLYSHYSALLYRILESLPSFLIWLFPFLALRGKENQNWYLTNRLARTVWVFWGFRFEGYCDPRTRGTCHAIPVSKRISTCNYCSCCSVCDTSADRNHLGKMHLKCLDTGTGSIGPSLFCDQVASTVQANGDLETSWTAVDSPQTVSWQNDVTICLEIDCVNMVTATGISKVSPVSARTSGPAAPAVTVS